MSNQQTYLVTDYVPEDKSYFTVGKWYKCNIIGSIASFVDNDGDFLKAHIGESHHLNGKPWQVKQGQPPADYVEDKYGNWSPPAMRMAEAIDLVPAGEPADMAFQFVNPAGEPIEAAEYDEGGEITAVSGRSEPAPVIRVYAFPDGTTETITTEEAMSNTIIETTSGEGVPHPMESGNIVKDQTLKLERGKKYAVRVSGQPYLVFVGPHPFNKNTCAFMNPHGAIMWCYRQEVIGPYKEKLRMPIGGCPTGFGWVAMNPTGQIGWTYYREEPVEVGKAWTRWSYKLPIPEQYWPTNYDGPWQESATPVSEIEFYDAEVER